MGISFFFADFSLNFRKPSFLKYLLCFDLLRRLKLIRYPCPQYWWSLALLTAEWLFRKCLKKFPAKLLVNFFGYFRQLNVARVNFSSRKFSISTCGQELSTGRLHMAMDGILNKLRLSFSPVPGLQPWSNMTIML